MVCSISYLMTAVGERPFCTSRSALQIYCIRLGLLSSCLFEETPTGVCWIGMAIQRAGQANREQGRQRHHTASVENAKCFHSAAGKGKNMIRHKEENEEMKGLQIPLAINTLNQK